MVPLSELPLKSTRPANSGRLPSRPRSLTRHPIGSTVSAFALPILALLGASYTYVTFEGVPARGPITFYILFPLGLMLAASLLGFLNGLQVVLDGMLHRQNFRFWITGALGFFAAIFSTLAVGAVFASALIDYFRPA